MTPSVRNEVTNKSWTLQVILTVCKKAAAMKLSGIKSRNALLKLSAEIKTGKISAVFV